MDPPTPAAADSERKKSPLVAILLSFLAPGLGLLYVGRLFAGLVTNVLFVLVVLLFVIVSSMATFFPLYPMLVLIGTWLVFCLLASWRAVEILGDGPPEKSASFQHPLIYLLVALLTFLAPLSITAHLTTRHLMTVATVEDPGMYPHIHPGDRVVIDRTSYRDEPPSRGDLVAVRFDDDLSIRRVVAVPSDEVKMFGYSLMIDDELAHHALVDEGEIPDPVANADVDAEPWIEHNHGARYVISMVPGTPSETAQSAIKLADDQFYLLLDNRSFGEGAADSPPPDSRAFGPVGLDQIEGQPTHVGWSAPLPSATSRLDRVGLRTE